MVMPLLQASCCEPVKCDKVCAEPIKHDPDHIKRDKDDNSQGRRQPDRKKNRATVIFKINPRQK